jgi:hypothetical protein
MTWSASYAEAGVNRCLLELVEGNYTTGLSLVCGGTLHLNLLFFFQQFFDLSAWKVGVYLRVVR